MTEISEEARPLASGGTEATQVRVITKVSAADHKSVPVCHGCHWQNLAGACMLGNDCLECMEYCQRDRRPRAVSHTKLLFSGVGVMPV